MPKITLLLATNNPGKVREIRSILKGLPVVTVTPEDLEKVPGNYVTEEKGTTFTENAVIKAEVLGNLTRLLSLADDSGLEIDALGGKPGVHSARFAKGGNPAKIKKVLRLLKNVPLEKRTARFVTAIAIFDPQTGGTTVFEGETSGKIMTEPRGVGGFGYDPVFYSEELGKTFAEASLKEKNTVSHRARALRKAKAFLKRKLASETK